MRCAVNCYIDRHVSPNGRCFPRSNRLETNSANYWSRPGVNQQVTSAKYNVPTANVSDSVAATARSFYRSVLWVQRRYGSLINRGRRRVCACSSHYSCCHSQHENNEDVYRPTNAVVQVVQLCFCVQTVTFTLNDVQDAPIKTIS